MSGGMPAQARQLTVGPKRTLKLPSEAAAVAGDGDVVLIDPGTYADCAVWKASHLRIEAAGGEVKLAGRSCAGKGIFITQGSGITVRGITFADAHVDEHNGAGIRAEGDNLTVERSRFIRNENGILAGGSPDSALRIVDSVFIGNGACIAACAHGVYAGGPIRLMEIERCVFLDTRVAHHIKSRARTTVVLDSRIEDGANGTSSYLIDVPDGGNLVIAGNSLQKGVHSSNREAAISLGEEGLKNPTVVMTIRDNRFRNDMPETTAFVRNRTGVAAVVDGNRSTGPVTGLVGPGGSGTAPR